MPQSKSKNNSSGKHPALLSRQLSPTTGIIFILIVVLVFSLLLNVKFASFDRKPSIPVLEDIINEHVNPTIYPTVCKRYGYPQKSSYLIPYTVQRGDSLLSITKNKLGDPSRITELINLNKDMYPQLSLQQPFLEVGWKLYLPPSYFPPSTGSVAEIQGVITAIDKAINPDSWEVQASDPAVSSPSYLTNISAGKFINKPRTQYHVGDCVTVFMFYDDNNGHYMILVLPQ